MSNNSIDNLTPAEFNILKQTLEVYRQTLQASGAAPRGEKLNCIEDCLLQNGRELLAKMAQEAINEETAKAENDEENRRCPHCHQKMRHRGSKKNDNFRSWRHSVQA